MATRPALRNLGTSLLFNGSSAKVQATAISGLDTIGCTWSCWFYANATTGVIVGNTPATTYRSVIAIDSNGYLVAGFYNNVSWPSYKSSTSKIALNRWHHVVVTIAPTETKIYLNGVVQTGTTSPGAQASSNVFLMIGSRTSSVADFFKGYIDEVRCWNSILTASQATDLYYGGVVDRTNLIGEWLFNEYSGSSATDSALGNTGTITNATYSSNSPFATRVMPRFMGGSTLFNGSTSTINCGATDIIGTGAVTVSAWIRPTGWGGSDKGRIIDNGKFLFTVSLSSPTKTLYCLSDGSTSSGVANADAILLGKWNHISVTRNASGTVNFYINGNLAGGPVASGTPTAATTNTFIGNNGAANRSFNGKLAEVKIFNSVLTASQAAELYSTGSVSGVSPVANYALDDQPSTYIDSIGGNNGTGTATTYSSDTPVQQRMVVRNFETSLSLITSQYAHIPNASQVNLNFGLSDFIVGGWFNINPASGLSMLMCKVSGSAFVSGASALGWELMYRGDQTGKPLQFRFNDGNVAGGLTIQTTSNTVGDGKWHHIAVAVDRSDKAHIYIDGKKIIDSTLSSRTGTWDSTGDFVIGARAGKDSSYLNGRISECFAYNFGIDGLSSLSQWENIIRNIYFNGKLDTDSLVLNLKLNEGAGTTAYDSSGNGNNGTITGATWSTNTPSKARKVVGGNLVKNGDFSSIPVGTVATNTFGKFINGTSAGDTVNIFGWALLERDTNGESLFTESGVLEVSNLATNSNAAAGITPSNSAANIIQYGIRLIPGVSYTLSGRVKTSAISGSATTGARLFANLYNAAGSYQTTKFAVSSIVTTTDWTTYSTTFTPSASQLIAIVYLNVKGNDGAATLIMDAWFADITLNKTTPTTRTTV